MPRLGGAELLVRLRERNPGLPAVVLSGDTGGAGGIDGVAAGLTTLLAKPVSARTLAAEVAALLDRVVTPPPP